MFQAVSDTAHAKLSLINQAFALHLQGHPAALHTRQLSCLACELRSALCGDSNSHYTITCGRDISERHAKHHCFVALQTVVHLLIVHFDKPGRSVTSRGRLLPCAITIDLTDRLRTVTVLHAAGGYLPMQACDRIVG